MLVLSPARVLAILTVVAAIAAPVSAQTALGPYSPVAAKYRITSSSKATQGMVGQSQESETNTKQLASLTVAPAGDMLALVMTLDSMSTVTTAPGPAPDVNEAIGLTFTGKMGLDGKVTSSVVTDKAGAPSTSQYASNFRSILPRLKPGATKGATWTDSSTNSTKQNDSDITTTNVFNYTLMGDTVVAGVKAWKIVGRLATKLTGKGNRMGAEFTIAGDISGVSTSLVSSAGVMLSQTSTVDSNLIVTIEVASMTIPITTTTTGTIEKLP